MTTATTLQPVDAVRVRTRVLALAVFLAGAGLVYVTGFAGPAFLHNAAHDSRHAMAFPCH